SETSASGAVPFIDGSSIRQPAVTRCHIVHVAGHDMVLRSTPSAKSRVSLLARRIGERAASMEMTARRRIDRVWWVAGDRRFLDPSRWVHRRPRCQESAGIGMKRALEDLVDRADLDRAPEIHD